MNSVQVSTEEIYASVVFVNLRFGFFEQIFLRASRDTRVDVEVYDQCL